MFSSDAIPALPDGAKTEGNHETLVRLRHDLCWSYEAVLSASDSYRFYGCDEDEQSFWGYCVETACVDETKEIFMLMHLYSRRTRGSVLRWVPMEKYSKTP